MLTTGAALAVDGRGNVMVPEEVSLRIVAAKTATFYGQKMTKGHIYTIARERQFREMLTVANDPADIVIFGKGALVKVLAARSGRFYGHKMTANHTYTVAGGGLAGPRRRRARHRGRAGKRPWPGSHPRRHPHR